MPKTRADQEPDDAKDGLCPSLCSFCRWGLEMRVSSITHADVEDDEFMLRPRRAFEGQTSYCRNPAIAGEGEPPLDIDGSVKDCQGFEARPIQVTSSCPEKRALRVARAKRSRRKRR